MKNLVELLKELAVSHFYGQVTITFEAGRIVHVNENRSHDPKRFTET